MYWEMTWCRGQERGTTANRSNAMMAMVDFGAREQESTDPAHGLGPGRGTAVSVIYMEASHLCCSSASPSNRLAVPGTTGPRSRNTKVFVSGGGPHP